MLQVLVLTHGPLCEILLESARTIAGEAPNVSALPLDWDDTLDKARDKLLATLDELDRDQGILILTDMYGGTPFNVARSVAEPGKVEIVTGVNLPMVVRLSCLHHDPKSLMEAASWIQGKGRQAICQCTTSPPSEQESGCD